MLFQVITPLRVVIFCLITLIIWTDYNTKKAAIGIADDIMELLADCDVVIA